MKKGILLTIALATMALFTNAQDNIIPNGGFDAWTSETAIPGWNFGGTAQRYNSLEVTSGGNTEYLTPHNGDYYLLLQNPSNTLGAASTSFATTARPTTFEAAFAFFRANANSQDRYRVLVTLSKWDSDSTKRDTIMAASITGPNGGQYPWNYTQLDLSGLYRNMDTPDSCFITIFAGITGVNQQGQIVFTPGSTLAVDAMKLNTNTVGISSVAKADLAIKNYPNPVSSKTTISYNVPTFSKVDVTITDITGKQVATVFSGEQAQGRQEVEFDATALKPGIYFYTVKAGNAVETKKFVVTR